MPDVLPALANRRARRAFDPRAVPVEIQRTLWEAVSLAPSHANGQPVRLVAAEGPVAREALFKALSEGNRQWAGAAPLLVAVLANPHHDFEAPNRDGSTRELWPLHTGIAVGNLLAQATELELVAHPMAGFDEAAVREALGIPQNVRVATVVAIGYPGDLADLVPDLRAREDAPRKRLPIENLVSIDRWDERQAVSARSPKEKK